MLIKRDIRDLIHEKRAFIRQLEAPGPICLRIRERAFDVTEQLALEQRFGQSPHVHRNHAMRSAGRESMQRLRDQSFARAVFACDQNVRVRRRDPRNHFNHRPHGRRFRDQVRRAAAQQLVRRFEPTAFAKRTSELDLRAHNREQAVVVPRLRHKIARAAFHRFDRQIDRRPGRHHDDRQRVVDLLKFRDHFEPFLARSRVARVIQVHHEQRVIFFLERVEDSGRRRDRVDLITGALKQNSQRFQHVGLIVRDQNSAHAFTLNREYRAVSITRRR